MLIREYQASWAEDYRSLKKILAGAVTTPDFMIEHVGSTAVPGLAAKPVIDIDVAYDRPESFASIKDSLEGLGYYHNGDQGIRGREVFKRLAKIPEYPLLDEIKHHLYVCQAGNAELRRHLLFRDRLRQSASARKAYAALKYRIAEQAAQDRRQYAARKEDDARDFIESVLAGEYR